MLLQVNAMDQVEQVKERTDIIQIISEHTSLKKAGRNFKANCPFHNENTPSFVVSPERQMWHCFGCGKGGDVFTFLMDYEHMDFPETLRFLAKRAGIELVKSPQLSSLTSKKEKLYKINRLAASFYHYILLSHKAGEKGLSYLLERKINKGALETYRVGFAPTSGVALITYLTKKKGCLEEDILEAGLGYMRNGRLRDFFIGRIMFPLTDHRDNIVGFSGRVIDASQLGPKYINTRETPIYHKGDQFFGIDIAKDALRKTEQAIVVEGEFDVISCFQEGIANTIAIKGTALTESQVRLLARFVKKVTLGLDDDSAGQEALVRSLRLLEMFDLLTTVIAIPNGKDPDGAIREDVYAFKTAVKNDIPVYDYLFEKKLTTINPKEVRGKKQFADFFLPILAQIQNQIMKEHYIKKLSGVLDTSYESLISEMARHEKPQVVDSAEKLVKDKRPREEVLEEYLLALLLQSTKPEEVARDVFKILFPFLPKKNASQKILYLLSDFLQEKKQFDGGIFMSYLPTELLESYTTSTLYPLKQFDDEAYAKEIKRVSEELLRRCLRIRLKEITLQMEAKKEEEKLPDGLQKEYDAILTLLQKD